MFQKEYILNLPHRKERLKEGLAECRKIGIHPDRFEAVEHHDPLVSFNTSMLTMLVNAYMEGYLTIAIFEDDVVIGNADHLGAALAEMPPIDWDMLYLGCTMPKERPERYSDHLFRLQSAWTTHAVVYRRRVIPTILSNFDMKMPFDEMLATKVVPYAKAYVVAPMIATQRPGFSDIRCDEVDYSQFFTDANKYLI